MFWSETLRWTTHDGRGCCSPLQCSASRCWVKCFLMQLGGATALLLFSEEHSFMDGLHC